MHPAIQAILNEFDNALVTEPERIQRIRDIREAAKQLAQVIAESAAGPSATTALRHAMAAKDDAIRAVVFGPPPE